MLSVLQHTWEVDGERRGKGLHLESGIIRVLADGRLEYSCAQNSGRTEVMVGDMAFLGDTPAREVQRLRALWIARPRKPLTTL